MPPFSVRYRGGLIALAATAILATTGIFIGYLLANFTLQPLTLAFWRSFLVGLFLLALMAVFNRAALRIGRRDVPFLAAYGFICLAFFSSVWTFSVQYNGAAVATVLAYSAPAFTVLLAWPLLKEAWTARKLTAVCLSMAGCVLVAGAYSTAIWQLNPRGIVFGLLSGLAYAVYNLAGRWSARYFASSWTVITYGFLFAALALAFTQRFDIHAGGGAAGILFGSPAFSLGRAWTGWTVLAILAVPTLLGFGLYTLSLRYLPASMVALIATLEPVLTAVMAIVFLHETLTGPQWLGSGLIVAAVVLVQSGSTAGEIPVLETGGP